MKKTTEQYAKEIKDKYNLVLTSEYTSAASKVRFKCANGHDNEATATNLLQRGYKCKECLHGRKITSKVNWDAEQLKQLVEEGASAKDIAALFNTTESAVQNACAKLNLSIDRSKRSYARLLEHLEGRVLLTTYEDFNGLKANVLVKCAEGHIVSQSANNIIQHKVGCPICTANRKVSNSELELQEYIRSIYSGWLEFNDRTVLDGQELDIVAPDLGLAIEYNGSYWHSDAKGYHYTKTIDALASGYKLIHVHEYDWLLKQNIVKSRLLAAFGRLLKVYARAGRVSQLDYFPKEFLNTNHLQGAGAPTKYNYGFFLGDELVAVMTFGISRFDEAYEYELIRYCSKLGTQVIGGASKMLKHFIKTMQPTSIISYANRDYSNGTLYEKLGFTYLRATSPGFKYYRRGELVTRYGRNHADMAEKGFNRVYDSGNLVYGLQLMGNFSI